MFQPAENASHELSANLVFQHEIDRAPFAEQRMFAIKKIACRPFRFPNPCCLSPHGSKARNDDAFDGDRMHVDGVEQCRVADAVVGRQRFRRRNGGLCGRVQ